MLRKRYNNDRLIIAHHVQAIFNIAPLTQENSSALRELSDTLQWHLGALKNLGERVDTWDTLIIHIIVARLNPVTKREWEENVAEKAWNKHAKLADFLADRSLLLEALQPAKTGVAPNKITSSGYKKIDTSVSHVTTTSGNSRCPVCAVITRFFNVDLLDLWRQRRESEKPSDQIMHQLFKIKSHHPRLFLK